MASLTVYNRSGAEVGKYDIEPTEIAQNISKQLLHDAVVMYQANQRQGSAKTKSRGEVSGASQKMYRQKGTGNARAGHRRSGVLNNKLISINGELLVLSSTLKIGLLGTC